MSWFATLRTVVYARRAVLALERLALATEQRTQLELARAERESPRRSKQRVTQFDALDQNAATEAWNLRQREEFQEPTEPSAR